MNLELRSHAELQKTNEPLAATTFLVLYALCWCLVLHRILFWESIGLMPPGSNGIYDFLLFCESPVIAL